MQNFKNTEDMLKQYGTASNLNSRISLHQAYSTNKLGWANWVFEQYQFRPNQRILELGCGNGGIWHSHAGEMPDGVQLTLSDFSQAMLDAAKANTDAHGFISYRVIDAQSIPFDDDTFDVVIANHMLYHVPDIDKALSEIARVLKPTGTLYATTIGSGNFKEIIKLLHAFDPRIDFAQDAITEAFGLESGSSMLRKVFKSVGKVHYEDSLHITEPQPLVDYILSSQGIGNINEIISGDNIARFADYVETICAKQGYIDVAKDAGMFTAVQPIL